MEASPDLEIVVRDQRILTQCISLYLLTILVGLFLPGTSANGYLIIALGAVCTIGGGLCAAHLSWKLSGKVWGVLALVFAFVPLVGLIPMMSSNSTATAYLRSQGLSVGIFGTKR